jgi:hypothetical protein
VSIPFAASLGAAALSLATRMVDEVGPRPAGTVPGDRAQAWVARELAERGWTPRTLRGRGPYDSSVYACRHGEQRKVVLLIAHTDSVHEQVPGANDNAAAVAVLLTAIESLPRRPVRTVCVAFPDGEELGLLGARTLAEHALRGGLGGPVDQVMALDLVGRGRLTHNGLGATWGSRRLRWLLEVAPAEVPWVYRGVSWAWPEGERSDHGPFASAGIPSSHLMARGRSGVFWAYHTPDDVPDVLERSTLSKAVRTVRRVARAGPVPREDPDPAVVLPWGTVLPGWLVWLGTAVGLGAGLGGVVGLPRVGGAVVQQLLATVAFGVGLAAALHGRDLGGSLAAPALLAAWCAWGAAVLAWPWPTAVRGGRSLALVPALLALAVAWFGAPMVALPLAVSATAAALSGRLPAVLLALPALWPAAYLVRPDAVRELAFHGLLPAVPWNWVVLHGLLTLPVVGLVQGRELQRGRLRVGAVAVMVVGVWVGWAWAWSVGPWEAPFVPRDVKWAG